MKAVREIILLIGTGLLPLAVARATPLEEAYLESCRKDPTVPVPITVVSPSVGPEYEGSAVHLEFLVDATGKPADFSIKSAPDDILATAVVRAVKLWRFQPAEIDGKPVARRVALPVRIVDADDRIERVAARE